MNPNTVMETFLHSLKSVPAQIDAAIITGSVASVAAYIAYRNRRSEQIKLTRDLYNQFFTLMDNRSITWFWLEELDGEEDPRSFQELWRVKDKDQTKFMHLYKVAAFWFLVYTLFKANQLNRPLAHSLFRYELRHWQKQVFSLTKRTRTAEKTTKEEFPEVLLPFESTDWLQKRRFGPRGSGRSGAAIPNSIKLSRESFRRIGKIFSIG